MKNQFRDQRGTVYGFAGERIKRRKHSIILLLQMSSAVLCITIVFLAVLLIYRNIRYSDNSNPTTPSSISQTVPQFSQTIPVETTQAIPSFTELLPVNPIVENYFGPLPVAESPEPVRNFEARGLYIGIAAAGSGADDEFAKNLSIVESSEMNAIVLNIKDEDGIRFSSENAIARELGIVTGSYDLKKTIEAAHAKNIKVIGRVLCFKDPAFAKKNTDYCIRDQAGNILTYSSMSNKSFINPYLTEYWEYIFSIAEEAIAFGIDEIQFDYVRFAEGKPNLGAEPYFGDPATTPSRIDTINRFLQTARIRIQEEHGIPITADVFAIILSSRVEEPNIGQEWANIGLTGISALCPMVYPSHYDPGTTLNGATFEVPNDHPHDVVYNALIAGKSATEQNGYAVVRPYLQATDGYQGDYNKINAQIRAVKGAGFSEWLLWNQNALYPEGAYDGN